MQSRTHRCTAPNLGVSFFFRISVSSRNASTSRSSRNALSATKYCYMIPKSYRLQKDATTFVNVYTQVYLFVRRLKLLAFRSLGVPHLEELCHKVRGILLHIDCGVLCLIASSVVSFHLFFALFLRCRRFCFVGFRHVI